MSLVLSLEFYLVVVWHVDAREENCSGDGVPGRTLFTLLYKLHDTFEHVREHAGPEKVDLRLHPLDDVVVALDSLGHPDHAATGQTVSVVSVVILIVLNVQADLTSLSRVKIGIKLLQI